MGTVCQLNQQHADITPDSQNKFTKIFSLLGIYGFQFNLAKLGNPINQFSDFLAKFFANLSQANITILYGVMQQRRDKRICVQFHICQQNRDRQRMRKIGLATIAPLAIMGVPAKNKGLVQASKTFIRKISRGRIHQGLITSVNRVAIR